MQETSIGWAQIASIGPITSDGLSCAVQRTLAAKRRASLLATPALCGATDEARSALAPARAISAPCRRGRTALRYDGPDESRIGQHRGRAEQAERFGASGGSEVERPRTRADEQIGKPKQRGRLDQSQTALTI